MMTFVSLLLKIVALLVFSLAVGGLIATIWNIFI